MWQTSCFGDMLEKAFDSVLQKGTHQLCGDQDHPGWEWLLDGLADLSTGSLANHRHTANTARVMQRTRHGPWEKVRQVPMSTV